MKFSKRQLFQRRATRAEEAKETRGCNERETSRVDRVAYFFPFERTDANSFGGEQGWMEK